MDDPVTNNKVFAVIHRNCRSFSFFIGTRGYSSYSQCSGVRGRLFMHTRGILRFFAGIQGCLRFPRFVEGTYVKFFPDNAWVGIIKCIPVISVSSQYSSING